jgi:hypothetical protein
VKPPRQSEGFDFDPKEMKSPEKMVKQVVIKV